VSVTIRTPVPADADRLARINIAAWRSAYAGIVPASYLDAMDLTRYRERWQHNLIDASPSRNFLVADVDGELAAYGICGPYRPQGDAAEEDTSGWGELYAIYTHPDRQGRGVGSAVLCAAVALLHDQEYADAGLWVLRDNHAGQRWYAARGWRPDGATSSWLAGDAALPELRLRRRL